MRKKDYIKFCLVLFILSLGGCPCKKNPIAPEGEWGIYPPMDRFPSWSPDRKTIVFYKSWPDNGVYFIDYDWRNLRGRNLRQFLAYPALWADWSPDGKSLVIEEVGSIYTIGVNKTNKKLIEGNTPRWLLSAPRWSPDGMKIAYYWGSTMTEDTAGIWIIDTTGYNKKLVLGGASYPDFSPDSKRIVCVLDNNIYIVNIDRTDLTKLTDTPKNDGYNSYPVWSPEGSKVAYELHSLTEKDGIMIMNSDGSEKRLLVELGFEPCWSPDATKIVYRKQMEDNSFRLWIINLDGTGEHPITF